MRFVAPGGDSRYQRSMLRALVVAIVIAFGATSVTAAPEKPTTTQTSAKKKTTKAKARRKTTKKTTKKRSTKKPTSKRTTKKKPSTTKPADKRPLP